MHRRDAIKSTALTLFLAALPLETAMAETDETVYELRTYHLNEGKLPLILQRFRSKETAIFARVGMHGVAYWTPLEEPLAGKTLIYMLRHSSREAARASWEQFGKDPEWIALKAESEKDGPFVAKIESTFLTRTDFSPGL